MPLITKETFDFEWEEEEAVDDDVRNETESLLCVQVDDSVQKPFLRPTTVTMAMELTSDNLPKDEVLSSVKPSL